MAARVAVKHQELAKNSENPRERGLDSVWTMAIEWMAFHLP